MKGNEPEETPAPAGTETPADTTAGDGTSVSDGTNTGTADTGTTDTTTTGTTVTKPSKTSITKVVAKKKALKVAWGKQDCDGYQLQYSTSVSFSKSKTKTKTVLGASKGSATIKSLKGKKTYYVRIRTFKTVNGVKICSAWSAAGKVKTK